MQNTTISLDESQTELVRVLAKSAKENNAWDGYTDVKKAVNEYSEWECLHEHYGLITANLWDYGLVKLKQEQELLDPRLLVTFTKRGIDFVNVVERTHDI